jgi:outer membrane protein assembly factor BamB
MRRTRLSGPAGPVLIAAAALLLSGAGGGTGEGSADWAQPNRDVASTRAQPDGLDRRAAARLRPVWRFRIPRTAAFESGAVTATPVVANGVVYVQDMASDVFALAIGTGRLRWKRLFNYNNPGPNGLAVDSGRVYGATDTTAFALSTATGKLLWHRRLVSPVETFVDMAPVVANSLVYIGTVGYSPGTRGAVYALDAATGTIRWRFATMVGPWRFPQKVGGGGAWYPPSVGPDGTVYWGTANPIPWGGTPAYPNGAAFPGPALFTDSLLALSGRTGRLRWYDQVTRHDIRDYDFQLSPIVAGNSVIGGGKAGLVVAWDAGSGRRRWVARVGVHRNDLGPLPRRLVPVCPGILGGVLTPMAYSSGRVYVPVVDLCFRGSAIAYEPLNHVDPRTGRGELVALDARTGRRVWTRRFPQPDFGCATAGRGIVFTSTFDGTVYGLDARNGSTIWRARTGAGINACPALAGDKLLVAAGVPLPGRRAYELVAYGPGGG